MSKATPTRTGDDKNGCCGGGGGSDDYRKRLRSYQTPPTVRKSPRFLPQITNNVVIALAITSRKQPPHSTKKPSSNKTHHQSPPVSPPPVPISKTHLGFSTKCLREPLRSVGNLQGKPLRRSARLSLMQCAKAEETKENAGVDGLNEEMGNADFVLKEAKEGKFQEEEKTMIGGLKDAVEKGNGDKARKMEGICEKKIGSERADAGECGGPGDWTMDQDAVLQRAYLVAKPSPHFWKKVAKMVPGKSAQECFDRVNGSLETPPQSQPRSRANTSNLSPIANFSLSGSKPVQHPIPLGKKLRSGKKNLVAQKTVRHLLKKHCVNDQSHEADHFSTLETALNAHSVDLPEISSPISPDSLSTRPGFLQKCSGGRSSAHQKMLSRFKPFAQENQPSPEVLKRIKNVALHEKYIDQLHNRDARRKNVGARVGKSEGEPKMGLAAAKTALLSEARQFISHFQQLRANYRCDSETEDDDEEDEEEDEEDE